MIIIDIFGDPIHILDLEKAIKETKKKIKQHTKEKGWFACSMTTKRINNVPSLEYYKHKLKELLELDKNKEIPFVMHQETIENWLKIRQN